MHACMHAQADIHVCTYICISSRYVCIYICNDSPSRIQLVVTEDSTFGTLGAALVRSDGKMVLLTAYYMDA